MTVGSDNPFPSVLFAEHVDPSNPSAGTQRLFVDTDHILKLIDSAGVVTTYSGASGAVATDAIWDAAGDLAVGSGANTAAKLTLGAAGGAVSRVNGAVAWNSGTSMPTATTGDRYWRTDLGVEVYYDGTRWLSVQMYASQTMHQNPTATTTYTAPTGTLTPFTTPAPANGGGSDIWLVAIETDFFVSGGTALGASHKWVATLGKVIAANTVTNLTTLNIDNGSSSVWRRDTTTIGALLNNGTTHYVMSYGLTKTGTPGALFMTNVLTYRVVYT